jgi:hypothetical protein
LIRVLVEQILSNLYIQYSNYMGQGSRENRKLNRKKILQRGKSWKKGRRRALSHFL